MNRSGWCSALLVAAVVGTGVAPRALQGQDESGGWEFVVTPWLWFTNVGGTLEVVGRDRDFAMDADEVFDALQIGFMAHVEASTGRFAVFAEPVFARLEQSGSVDTALGVRTATVSLDLTAFDLAGAYRVAGPLDAVLGARYLGTGVSAEGDGGALSEDRDSNVWNAFVGARIRTMMAEKWGILVHGDLGFGGSDQNFMTQAAVQFRPVPRFGIDVGYKWLHNEVTDPARPVGIDMDLRGAVLGVSFVF